MAINNPTPAASSQHPRYGTPQPTQPQETATHYPLLKLYATEWRDHVPMLPTLPLSSAESAAVTVTRAPQLQAAPTADSPRSQLRAAARDGDGTAIKRLMANHEPDLTAADPATGMTALMLAALGGHDDVVLLLTKGMQIEDINQQTTQGDSALILAAVAGHADVVSLLIWKGAWHGRRDSASACATVSGTRHDQQFAASSATTSMPAQPLPAPATTAGAVTTTTRTIAMPPAATAMFQEEDHPAALREKKTPLMSAAKRGETDNVRALLDAGAKVDQAKADGMTALMWAAQNGHAATLKILLDAGANCGLRAGNGQTALTLAIHGKHDEVIDLLPTVGADID
jgi:ankyrin repeat protein